MAETINPALAAFLNSFTEEREWGQVIVRRSVSGFELRHVQDRARGAEELRVLSLPEVRGVSLVNARGQFRPLKAAPDLAAGWRVECKSPAELWRVLQELYPGSLADWHAEQSGSARPANYREFTGRQTGMYRITQLHSDEEAAQVIAACCDAAFCLKRRLWSVEGLPADAPTEKSAIPCLEPCAVLLELSRKAARINQEEKIAALSPSELASVTAALESALADPPAGSRLGDIASPLNPRRLKLLLTKYRRRGESGEKLPLDSSVQG